MTRDNFTPRPGKDTIGRPGQTPGLSASLWIAPGKKAQGIDLRRLRPPLKAFPDDVEQGGTAGHVAIAPVDENGQIDVAALEAWASYRNTDQISVLTQSLLDAIVEPNARGAS